MSSLIKIHLGGGERYIPGFVHIDRVSGSHVDHVQDIRRLGNFTDGSVYLIYACRVIEYFDPEELPAVLAEWKRVLMPEGILRVSVPNFEVISKLYQAGIKLESFLDTIYGRVPDGRGGWLAQRMVYDERSLEALLRKAHFGNPRVWHSRYEDSSQSYFPPGDKEHGVLLSLNLEAIS